MAAEFKRDRAFPENNHGERRLKTVATHEVIEKVRNVIAKD